VEKMLMEHDTRNVAAVAEFAELIRKVHED
jgi:hypothetical protein